jgi:hypothetical protein
LSEPLFRQIGDGHTRFNTSRAAHSISKCDVIHSGRSLGYHYFQGNEQILLNSDIDKEAFKKSFTLYLQEYIENILPKELAENELSLIKGKVRKTIT